MNTLLKEICLVFGVEGGWKFVAILRTQRARLKSGGTTIRASEDEEEKEEEEKEQEEKGEEEEEDWEEEEDYQPTIMRHISCPTSEVHSRGNTLTRNSSWHSHQASSRRNASVAASCP